MATKRKSKSESLKKQDLEILINKTDEQIKSAEYTLTLLQHEGTIAQQRLYIHFLKRRRQEYNAWLADVAAHAADEQEGAK
jgi:hypothetical protein